MLGATSLSAEELQYTEHSSELQYSGKERALYARCYSTKTVELQTLLSATAQAVLRSIHSARALYAELQCFLL